MMPAFCWPSNSWRDQTTASAPLPDIRGYVFRGVQIRHAETLASLKIDNHHHYASFSLDAIWHEGERRQHFHYFFDSWDWQELGPKSVQLPAQHMGPMVSVLLPLIRHWSQVS